MIDRSKGSQGSPGEDARGPIGGAGGQGGKGGAGFQTGGVGGQGGAGGQAISNIDALKNELISATAKIKEHTIEIQRTLDILEKRVTSLEFRADSQT